jgi:AcrR family transcriptional regulator
LIEATVEFVRTRGPDAVTLRKVARAAGVSEAAPYHHFRDKRHLLAAAAGEGFAVLHTSFTRAVSRPGGDAEAELVAIACAYVRFALDQPGRFRLMFGGHVAEFQLGELEEVEPGRQTTRLVRDVVARFVEAHAPGASVDDLFAQLWAQIHGLAWLVVERELRPQPSSRHAVALARDAVARLLASHRRA